MIKFYKLFFISLLVCFAIINVSLVNASDVTAQDLGVSEPTILPNSPFYFLKEWGRGIQSFFTFGQLKKTELEQKFANERLIELKKLVEEGKISQDILEKATEKYQKTMEKVKERADKIKDDATNNEDVNKFLEKFTNQQVLHEKILQKLEEKVPVDVLQKIKDARETHLERFNEVMTKLRGNKEKEEEIACTMEAKQCPDGSYVSRTGANCEFAPCPSGGGATGCEKGTTWDENQKKCANCPEGTTPSLVGPIWKCI